MVGIGIVGCGKITQVRHIPEYLASGKSRLVGVYDLDLERARKIAEKYEVKYYNSYEELLADEKIEAVSICTANQTHAEISVAAMKAGKHVLCEKPMATTLEECEMMVDMAKEAGKVLMIGQNQRLTKAHQKARQLIRRGEIGDVLSFRTTFGHGGPECWSVEQGKKTWFFDKEKARLGAIGDLGIHKTDLIQFLLDQRVVEVMAKVATLDKKDENDKLIGVDDHAICIYTMENGVIGTMVASWTFYGKEDNSTIIYGTKGMLRIYEHPEYAIEIITNDGEKVYYDLESIQTNDHQTATGIIDLFLRAVREDAVEYIDGESVMKAMRAVFASIESSNSGKAVKI